MGRSILHRKVIQNRRRALDPDADHMMAATHYNSDAYDDFVELRDRPPVTEAVVQLTQTQLNGLLARIHELEKRAVAAPAPELQAVMSAFDKTLESIDRPEESPG